MLSTAFLVLLGASLASAAHTFGAEALAVDSVESSVHWKSPPVTTTEDVHRSATTIIRSVSDLQNSMDNSNECKPQPAASGPTPDTDNPLAFHNFQTLRDTAIQAPTPANWTCAFIDKSASSKASHYLSYSVLESYNTTHCAAQCDQIFGCKAINIYFERTPTLYLGHECPDAPSMTVIKCVF